MKTSWAIPTTILSGYFSLVAPQTHANIIDDLSERLKQSTTTAQQTVGMEDERDNIFFKENPEVLASMNLQMGVKILTPEAWAKDFKDYDYDGFMGLISDGDTMAFSKTAFVYKGVKSEDFHIHKTINKSYIDLANPESKNSILDEKSCVVRQITTYGVYDITTDSVHAHYDLDQNQMINMDKETSEWMVKLAPYAKPNLITTSYIAPDKISAGSYGGRSINYFYNLKDNAVLHISYRISSFKYIWGLSWKIIPQIEPTLRKTTLKSLANIREYFTSQVK